MKITDQTKPEDFRNIRGGDNSHIKGWGIDTDVENDPTYPMKDRTDEEQSGYSWERPLQQEVDVKVLRSVERPNVTAVFGTSVPPRGLSGIIRNFAFKFSESSYTRWIPLVMADRINVIEGIIADISRGYFPKFFAERGWKSEWKFNRLGAIRKITVNTLVVAGIVTWIIMRRKRKNAFLS
ncbi:MAG TPA: hypothetical protein VK172_02920 [Lentimicrobium sp.]|jgi:hypothetical protein|nr:hypothetical protein [Lentimicrobium sp.]